MANNLTREEHFPIDSYIPTILGSLAKCSNLVLEAAPGAGKTTRVAPACLREPWLGGKKIVMLEPRRLAARGAAHYIAAALGEKPGQTVGFRSRGESNVGPATRLEIVTEAILTRMIQNDASLAGVGLVIFDEFHERSLHADLGLALCLEVQQSLRPDLRIVVMSATLDCSSVAKLMGDAPRVTCPGRAFPVETEYLPAPSDERQYESHVCSAVLDNYRRREGDILVFLPGRAEIVRVRARLELKKPPEMVLCPLMSELSLEDQLRALRPAARGARKVILATSIAETSLTVPGVRTVIDSGLQRLPRFDPARGMSRLVTQKVSRASADQRCGRAGREAPGYCIRLWDEAVQRSLAPFSPPEILESDLTSFVLELKLWGKKDFADLALLEPLPQASVQQALSLLRALRAIDTQDLITKHGREIANLGVHPRLGHMLLRSRELALEAVAADCAALLEERDPLRGKGADLTLYERWIALQDFRKDGSRKDAFLSRILAQSEQLRQKLRVAIDSRPRNPAEIGILVALAYPDRIAMKRENAARSYLLSNGSGAELPPGSLLAKEEFLAIADLQGRAPNARIVLAEPIQAEDLEEYFAEQFEERREVGWNGKEQTVVSRVRLCLGALVLRERAAQASDEELAHAILAGIRERGAAALPWSEASREFQARSEWLRLSGFIGEEWPDLSDRMIESQIEQFLAPVIAGLRNVNEIQSIDLLRVLQARFSWQQGQTLERLAPATIQLPSGHSAKISYQPLSEPRLAVRLQEMFGQAETPKIAGGKVGLLLELLSPARRPLQVTKDLSSFWANSYREVRKEMLGRYPKHAWPEDPRSALPPRKRPKN